MDEFFIEERLIGMYESYNSPILEEFKKNSNKGKKSEYYTRVCFTEEKAVSGMNQNLAMAAE